MAYVDSSLLEDDQQNQQGGPSLGNSGAPNAAAPNAAPGTAPTASSQQKTPGNFANLNDYLRVNQPQQFGQQVAGKIGNEIDQGNQAVDQASDQFKQRVDANTVKDNNGLINQAVNDPTKVDAGAYGQLRDAQYSGPKSLADTQDLSSQVQGAAGTAVGKAGASQSEGGRFALLDSYFGRPNYSQGQKSLDNLLIQSDPGSQQAFQGVQQRAQDLSSKTNALNPSLQAYAGQGAQQTADTRKAARGAVGIDDQGNLSSSGPLQTLYSQAQQRAQDLGTKNSAAYQSELDAAKQNRYALDPAFLKAMGLDPSTQPGFNAGNYLSDNRQAQVDASKASGYGTNNDYLDYLSNAPQGQNALGVDAGKYLAPTLAPTAEQSLTSDEASRGRALEALSGTHSQFANFDQAGQAEANPFTFNKQGYLNEIGTNQAALNAEVAAQDKTKGQNYANWVAAHPWSPTDSGIAPGTNGGQDWAVKNFNDQYAQYLGQQKTADTNKQAILDKYLKGVGA